jgi:hypothetical protein
MESKPPEIIAPQPRAEIVPSTNATLTVEYAPRRMRMVTLTETEVDELASSSGSIHLTFFGSSLGAFIALAIVLATVSVPEPRKFAAFVASTIVAGGGTVFFGLNMIKDVITRRRRIQKIKAGLL